jgi:UPF0716 protein FxsA
LGYLILLFTLIPALDLYVLIEVGRVIGAGNTIFLIILTGVLGATLARLQGFLVIQEIQRNLDQGIMPTAQMLNGLMIFCGGVLLIIPGFITDIMGLLLLLPFVRTIIRIIINRKIELMINEGRAVHINPLSRPFKRFDDIDIE